MAVFRREVDIWFGFSHPHVIRLFGACHVGRPFFVCENATNGTLVSYLRKHPNELWPKLHEASLGVQYLHARGVVHGDLKGNNIVIGSDRRAKVTDFGLSSFVDDDSSSEISAASHWVAPECIIGEKLRATFASDIYSLGMCVLEALRVVEAGDDGTKICLPWGNLDNNVVRYYVKQRKLSSRPPICNGAHWELVQQMCAFDPEERLKISTVVDQLARLASTSLNEHELTTETAVNMRSVPNLISKAREMLARLQNNSVVVESRDRALYSLYGLLWNDLDQLHHQIDHKLDPASIATFCSLAEEALASTNKLQHMASGLTTLAETAMQCHALRRRVIKFAEAHFLSPPFHTSDSGGTSAKSFA